MRLTRIATVMIFMILRALPSKISDAAAPVNCSAQRLQVAILLVPPLTLKTSYNDVKTYVSCPMNKVKGGILGDLITRIIRTCIKWPPRNDHVAATKSECFQVTNFEDEQGFLEFILRNDSCTDIAFPISSRMKRALSGKKGNMTLSFDDLIETPGYSLIMDTVHFNDKANTVVMTKLVQNVWPIVVLAFLFAGIAGICVWVLETSFNEEQFPRSFTRGIYEGFWWSFVSMTTVG